MVTRRRTQRSGNRLLHPSAVSVHTKIRPPSGNGIIFFIIRMILLVGRWASSGEDKIESIEVVVLLNNWRMWYIFTRRTAKMPKKRDIWSESPHWMLMENYRYRSTCRTALLDFGKRSAYRSMKALADEIWQRHRVNEHGEHEACVLIRIVYVELHVIVCLWMPPK